MSFPDQVLQEATKSGLGCCI